MEIHEKSVLGKLEWSVDSCTWFAFIIFCSVAKKI